MGLYSTSLREEFFSETQASETMKEGAATRGVLQYKSSNCSRRKTHLCRRLCAAHWPAGGFFLGHHPRLRCEFLVRIDTGKPKIALSHLCHYVGEHSDHLQLSWLNKARHLPHDLRACHERVN